MKKNNRLYQIFGLLTLLVLAACGQQQQQPLYNQQGLNNQWANNQWGNQWNNQWGNQWNNQWGNQWNNQWGNNNQACLWYWQQMRMRMNTGIYFNYGYNYGYNGMPSYCNTWIQDNHDQLESGQWDQDFAQGIE